MKVNFTRGKGIFDQLLARLRANKASDLLKDLQNRRRILDIGCGSYPLFLTSVEFKDKYGIDPVLKNTSIQGITLKKINVEQEKISFQNGYFDAVTMLAVFEHINKDKLDQVLNEIYRILSVDGKLVITTPSPWSDKLLHALAKFGVISSEEIHEHKHNQSRKDIKEQLVDVGFDKNKIKSGYFEGSFNMWFVAQK